MVPLRRVLPALLAALALLLTGLVAPVSAAPADAPGRLHGYLALGDSVPFGFRPNATTPPETYLDAAGFTGYPELLARRSSALRPLANASCPGETTASLVDDEAPSNGCTGTATSTVGYRDLFPLHVAYAGSQLDYAVDHLRRHPRTRLVTLTVGANDLFLCATLNGGVCSGDALTATLGRIRANVATTVAALRGEAGYRHRIVIATYYSPDYRDPVTTAGISAVNAALVAGATPYGVRVADGFKAFERAAAAYDGDVCAAGLLIPLPTGGCDIHPTPAGHRVLTGTVRWAAARP